MSFLQNNVYAKKLTQYILQIKCFFPPTEYFLPHFIVTFFFFNVLSGMHMHLCIKVAMSLLTLARDKYMQKTDNYIGLPGHGIKDQRKKIKKGKPIL